MRLPLRVGPELRPTNPTAWLHTLRLRLAQDFRAHTVARADYWLGEKRINGECPKTGRVTKMLLHREVWLVKYLDSVRLFQKRKKSESA
jgi:hypothetical protein